MRSSGRPTAANLSSAISLQARAVRSARG
jgi:hypothetical protein